MLSLVLAGPQIKHFKMVLQCLNKIGTELLMEATQSKLKLQAINTSKSAFFAITFDSTFFESFTTNGVQVVQAGVLLKHVLAAMKTSKVSRMQMDVDPQTYQIIIYMEGLNGLVKRYRLESMQSDILDANLQRDDFPITVVAEAAELNRLLSTFQHSQEEITIIANPDTPEHTGPWHHACQLQSFLDPKKARSGSSLQTSMTVDAHSVFCHYSHQAGETCDVTFNLRDLRAMVMLCEHMQANVTIRIDKCGVPLLVEPHFTHSDHPGYSAELILATLVESQIGAAMPMPQDVIPQPQPPDVIGQQQDPQQELPPQQPQPPLQQQRVGPGAHQGGAGIVRFNHQGFDERAGFEGVEAEEEVVLQEAGMQPWVEPAADGVEPAAADREPPEGAGNPPFAERAAEAGKGPSPLPPQPLQHTARPQIDGAPSASYGGGGAPSMSCGSRGPLHNPAAAASDPHHLPSKPAPSLGKSRMPLQGSTGPRSVDSGFGQAHHEKGGYARGPSSYAGVPNRASNGGVPPLHGRKPNQSLSHGEMAAFLNNAPRQQISGGRVPPLHSEDLHQSLSHGEALPTFVPKRTSSWRANAAAGDRQPYPPSPQPVAVQQRHASAASGGLASAENDDDIPLMGLDDPEHLPGARSPSPFRTRGLGGSGGLQPLAPPYQANNSGNYNESSRVANAHGPYARTHVHAHTPTTSHTSPSHATAPTHHTSSHEKPVPHASYSIRAPQAAHMGGNGHATTSTTHTSSHDKSMVQESDSIRAPQAAHVGGAGLPEADASTLHSPAHAPQPLPAAAPAYGHVNSGAHQPGAAGGRTSGSITFPQLCGASRHDGSTAHVPYLPMGQANGAAGMAAAPGYQQYAQHQHQQQQQQPTVGEGSMMAVDDDDDDDDVLPGTPEEEQPANDRNGPSIIGMRGMP